MDIFSYAGNQNSNSKLEREISAKFVLKVVVSGIWLKNLRRKSVVKLRLARMNFLNCGS